MADPCTERERIDRLATDVGGLKVGQAVTAAKLEAMSARQDEHHAAQLTALGDVKTDNATLSVELINEVRANRPADPAKNPKVLALVALVVIALAAPQLLGPIVSWGLSLPEAGATAGEAVIAEAIDTPAETPTAVEQPAPVVVVEPSPEAEATE